MASQWPPKKNTAFTLFFSLYKSDGTIIANPGTYTKKVSIDGAAVADITASVTEEDTTYGQLSVVLSASEMNGDAIWVYIVDNTAGCVPFTCTLYTAANLLDDVKTDTAAILADTGTDGVVVAAGSKTGYTLTATTGLGNQTADITGNLSGSVGSIASGGITAASLAADVQARLGIVAYGTAQAVTGTSIQLASASTFSDDELIGSVVVITGGSTGVGQSRMITDYVSSTDTATVDTWTTTPTGTITYVVFAAAPASATSVPAVNVTQISGDATAADNAEAFFDGTGYAGTNNVIPTVTTLTNLPAITANWLTAAGMDATAGAEIADAVWDEAMGAHNGAGSAGLYLANTLADTDELQTDWVNGGRLDLILDATATGTAVADVPTVAEFEARTLPAADYVVVGDTLAAVTTVGSVTGAVGSVTGAVGSVTGNVGGNVVGSVGSVTGAVGSVTGAVGSVTGAVGSVTAGVTLANDAVSAAALSAAAIDEILDEQIGDGTITMRQALRVMLAAMAGKLTGAATTSVTIRNLADTADVIVAVVDADGNRSPAPTVTP